MKLDRSHAQSLLARIRGLKVAVLGDLILDEYLFGEVSRISPEAPVPIVRVVREKAVLGGAANVAANLRALGAEPLLIGTLQKDAAGMRLMDLLAAMGISSDGLVLDATRPTIIKTRVIGQNQQMLRIDREEPKPLNGGAVEDLTEQLERCLTGCGALIVSDYAKGVIGAEVMEAARALCSQHAIPWIVDPKPAHRALYRGATLMTPNMKETAELTGLPARTDEEVAKAGHLLLDDLGLSGVLITRSEKGMALFMSGKHATEKDHREPWMIPTQAQEVFDVSGAGDTVIAAFSAAVASGADWKDAAMLANAAAGLVVAKAGTATVTADELLAHYHEQEAR